MSNDFKDQKLSISKILNNRKKEAVLPASQGINPPSGYIPQNKPIKKKQKKSKYEVINDNDGGENEINLKDYLEIVFHYKWLILIIFITVLLATIAYSFTQDPIYKAMTKIFIHEDVMELQVINNKPYFKQAYDLKTWIQIMKSTEITRRASEKLSNRVSASAISGMMEYDTERDEEHIITASATSKDPNLAADVANAVYYALSEYDTEQRLRGYDYSVKYLEQLMRDKRSDLDEVLGYINDFMLDKGIDLNTANIEDNIGRVNDIQLQISTCKVDLAAISASIKKINYDLNREDNSIVNQTTYSEPYKIRLMNLEAEKARALTNYTEKHPKILGIQQNIDNVKKLIEDGINERIQLKNVVANPIKQRLVNDLLANETEKVALEQKIAALLQILSEIEISADYKKLLDDKFTKKKDLVLQIGNLQSQYNNAKLNSNIASSRLYQLQSAEVPTTPSANNLKRNILVGIVLGLGLGFGLALLLNSLNDTIHSVSDYEAKYTIPIIGTIPKIGIDPLNAIEVDSHIAQSEIISVKEGEEPENNTKSSIKKSVIEEIGKIDCIFEPIIINFKYLMLSKDQKTFAIQSALQKEGKTFLSYYLAKSLAKENLNVLIVDTDFFKRTLTKELDCREKSGLTEVLSEQTELNKVIIRNKEHKFWFMPAGKRPPNVLEMYKSTNFRTVLEKLKSIYDIIIIDSPAFLLVPSITYFLSAVDGTILPVRINSTTHSNLNRMISKSELYDINIMGTIMNYAQVIDKKYYKYEYNYNCYYDKKDKKQRSKKERKILKDNQDLTLRVRKMVGGLYNSIKNFLIFQDEEEE
ncbi:MAG: AAA family ATPase [Candidatus Cloacimonetes bacterium]|nr:AAA family ATPase [Candidatus Cloacimonadota bacterium]MBT5420490.1 AAA family ATPase [Candidatus Cloacimonadota bacterium]